MKKITIGRGRECDVRLSDESEKVSRKHAIITVSPLGKMKIYDTSSNGTSVNGQPVEKPEGKPLKRGDIVNFANTVDLDWNTVRNPYRKVWRWGGLFLIVAVFIIVIFWIGGETIMKYVSEPKTEKSIILKDSISPVDNSLRLETPKEKRSPGPRTTTLQKNSSSGISPSAKGNELNNTPAPTENNTQETNIINEESSSEELNRMIQNNK